MPRLRGDAVYWPPLNEGKANDTGVVEISNEPIPIKVHWEDIQKEYRDPMGNIMVSTSVVMADRELLYKGILKKGKMSNLASVEYEKNSGVFQIQGASEIPNVRETKVVREYYL